MNDTGLSRFPLGWKCGAILFLTPALVWLSDARSQPTAVGAAAAARPRPEGAGDDFATSHRRVAAQASSEHVNPEAARAIGSGLAWLGKQQAANGSYGSGA